MLERQFADRSIQMAIGREKWGHGNSVLELHRWDHEGFKEMWEFLHWFDSALSAWP
jgi:hypothetical protein